MARELSIIAPSPPLVLIVDDHADTAEMVAEYLAARGTRSVRAESVAQARQILAGLHVDAVVTDFSMPGADGLDLLEELRSTPTGGAMPVVMVSAHDRADSVAAAAAELGAWFVAKPFDLPELARTVRTALLSGLRRASKPPADRRRITPGAAGARAAGGSRRPTPAADSIVRRRRMAGEG